MILLPFISAACYLIGGQWWKPARWLMGIPIGLIGLFSGHPYSLLAIPAYWIATSAFPYGDGSWLNIFGECGKWAICGFVFGLASAPVLGYWSIAQAIVSGGGFVILHYLDEKDVVKNPFQELLRGFIGTILFTIA